MKKFSIIILIFGAFFFNKYGAKSEVGLNNFNTELLKEDNPQITSSDKSQKVPLGKSNAYSEKNLKVDNYRCIGCGKCALVAPDNFAMNRKNRIAEVISQENISGAEVSRAQRICPVMAITI